MCGKKGTVFVFLATSWSLLDYGETASLFMYRRLGGPQRQYGAVKNRTSSPRTRSGDQFPSHTVRSQSTKLTTLSHSAQYSGLQTFILISLYSRSNMSFQNTRRDMLLCLSIRQKKIVLWPGNRYLLLTLSSGCRIPLRTFLFLNFELKVC